MSSPMAFVLAAYGTFNLILLYSITHVCCLLKAEVKKLDKTCKNLQQICSSEKELEELRDFAIQIEMSHVKFTAGRYYEVNRNTVFLHMSVVFSYFVAMVHLET
ncbi:unnamed protein product [Ceutorhynchus assimilis]|uniref:Gustatory receptor n=1 Tax=Ceutorhynchus assimilis TaxID=467358 RepID=A0A9P0GQH2_9CUCU|nr:unnamed protein product [Ceutorhynchus assimilis]